MKHIKLFIITLLVLVLIPINNVFAESYNLESNLDLNNKHYYLPKYIPLPVSNNIKVIEEESSIDDYLVDYNDSTWGLYTVTLEVELDGTQEAFDDLKNKINNAPYNSLSYTTTSYLSDESFSINGKQYKPATDILLLAMGEELSIKSLNGNLYAEDESTGWTVFIQYLLNRYQSLDELNECIDSNDTNEVNMRKGLVQISLFYPKDKSIDSYYGLSNELNSSVNITLDNILEDINQKYQTETSENDSTIILDDNGKELLEIQKQDNNQMEIIIKDETLEEDEVYEIIVDLATSMISDDLDGVEVTVNKDGTFTISNKDQSEVISIFKNENGNISLKVEESSNDLTSNNLQSTNQNKDQNDNITDVSIDKVLILSGIGVLLAIITAIVAICALNKKKIKK